MAGAAGLLQGFRDPSPRLLRTGGVPLV